MNWLIQISTILLLFVKRASGGSCWSTSGKNGQCGKLLRHGVTFKQCCQSKDIIRTTNHLGYSDRDAKNSRQWFFLVYINRPRICKPCSDPCNGVKCGSGGKLACTVSKTRRARCVCVPDCSRAFPGKVCGNDQITYNSECSLLREKCQSKKNIEINYYSECKASCVGLRCPAQKICVEDQYRIPHCVTNSICKKNCKFNVARDEMLCGTNGVTYLNKCFLRQTVCHLGNGRSIGIAYKGRCKGRATCSSIRCTGKNKCLVNKISVRCVKCKDFCIGGFNLNRPICGSDGVTYKNWCSLRRAACKSGRHIDVRNNGEC